MSWPDLKSLRVRLVLAPTAILVAALIIAIGIVVTNARGRVRAEEASGMRLGADLLADALVEIAQSSDPDRAYAALVADLPRARHVSFSEGDAPELPPTGLLERLLAPRSRAEMFPVLVQGRRLGTIVMRSNPSDELDEIGSELLTLGVLLLLAWVVTILLIFVTVTRGLRPLHALVAALKGLEHDEAVTLPPLPVAELRPIGASFDHLSAALARARADNRGLIGRLMSAQEDERRQLARELHDEIGPLLFGIRTDIACILRWSEQGRLSDVAARTRSLADHADGLQQINRRMLARMPPLVLEQAGLVDALHSLADFWRTQLPETDWAVAVMDPPDDLDPAIALVAFRVAQEALTNAARHARARRVEVRLTPQADRLHVSVRDDGCGIAATAPTRAGYGLLGMTERVRQAGGDVTVRRHPDGGTEVDVHLPLGRQTACASC